MKIKTTELSKDKNGSPMKILEMENDVKVFVNSKYEKEIFDAIKEDSDIELVKDDNFWKVKPESLGLAPKPAGGGYKSNMIKEAQNNKATQISHAQDRTALMWAKNNAVELIANHPAYNNLTEDQVEEKISVLASKILNSELQPF